MRVSLRSLAVNLAIAGSPFSPEVVETIRRSGIGRAEFPLVKQFIAYESETAVSDAASRLKEAGIEVWSCHPAFGGQWDISQLDEAKRRRAVELNVGTFAATRHLGSKLTIMHPSAEPVLDADRSPRIGQARKSLRELAAAAAPLGLRLAVELLPRSCLGRTSEELMAIIGDLDAQTVGACLDANHANLREDLAHSIRVLGDRLLTLHISDNDGIDERHWLPGQGIINWPGFIRALESSNYAGAFVYETTSKTGPGLHALAEVRENFSDLLEKAHKN